MQLQAARVHGPDPRGTAKTLMAGEGTGYFWFGPNSAQCPAAHASASCFLLSGLRREGLLGLVLQEPPLAALIALDSGSAALREPLNRLWGGARLEPDVPEKALSHGGGCRSW